MYGCDMLQPFVYFKRRFATQSASPSEAYRIDYKFVILFNTNDLKKKITNNCW